MAPQRALRADEPPHDRDEAPQQEQMPIFEGVPPPVHATTPASTNAQFFDALAFMLQGGF